MRNEVESTTKTRSREDFLQEMAGEASKLERLARQLREGKWETLHIEETFTRKRPNEEEAVVVIRASRQQKLGTGPTLDDDEEPPLEFAPELVSRFTLLGEKQGVVSRLAAAIQAAREDHHSARIIGKVLVHFAVSWTTSITGYGPTWSVDELRKHFEAAIAKLEQANAMPGGNEHQDKEGGPEDQPA